MVERVLFPFRGSQIGGSHVATFTLARALQQAAIEGVVICPDGTAIMEEAKKAGLRTVSSGEAPTGRNNLVTDFSRISARRRILEGERADGCVMHCNDINSLRAWGLPARLSGIGVVYHHHALNRLWWPPHLLSLGYANEVLCISDITVNAMKRWRSNPVKELNPFELDPAYDCEAARKALLHEFGWRPDARIIGWIGNFWARKRPDFFLQVAAELYRRDPKCRFVMFGRDGDYSLAEIKRMAIKHAVDEVTAIPGFRLPVETNLAPLDLLLAPAPTEPFGRALVEAIILGAPVVATRGAGHSEIIGAWGGGLLSNEADTPAEAAALCLQVLAAPDRYRLSGIARRKLAEDVTPQAHARRVLGVYERAARTPHRTSERIHAAH